MAKNYVKRMRLPPPGAGTAFGVCVVVSVVSSFVGLAVSNVQSFAETGIVALVVSVLWLVLVSMFVASTVRDEGGVRCALVTLLGFYSRTHFVEVRARSANGLEVGFGYRFLGFTVYYLRVDACALRRVTWNAGQASDLARRDLEDWLVAVSYGANGESAPLEKIHIVGPSRPRDVTAALGRALLGFLRSVGVVLESPHPLRELRFDAGRD